MKKFLISFAIIALSIPCLNAQEAKELKWGAGFYGFFDNREYWNDYVTPQTMGGTRGYGNIGLAINEYQEFAVGLDFLYEFGAYVNPDFFNPILYFKHEKNAFKFQIGAFPRINLINQPAVLLTDTLYYYRPNVEGIFFEARKSWGYHNVWLDWTSRQTETERETFLLGGTGGLNFGSFFYEHNFLMYHFAGPMIDTSDHHVRDNGGATAAIGFDLSDKTIFDTLRISTGLTFSYDGLRGVYENRFYYGSLTQLQIQYRGIGIQNNLYFGDGQVQLMGDGMYLAKFYNRTDFYYSFFRRKNLSGRVEFSMHLLPDGIINYSQRLVVSMRLNGGKKLKNHH